MATELSEFEKSYILQSSDLPDSNNEDYGEFQACLNKV